MNPALDAAIGRRMGLEPRRQLVVRGIHGECLAKGIHRVKKFLDRYPGPVGVWEEYWPPLSSDMGLAWRMVEWMVEQEDWRHLAKVDKVGYRNWFHRPDDEYWNGYYAEHVNPATAIAHAMAAALGIEVPAEEVRS